MASTNSHRIVLSAPPFPALGKLPEWNRRSEWPSRWISCDAGRPPVVAAYRLVVELPASRTVRLHVTGDERYRLFHNGHLVGSGSERGDLDHWFFETYELEMLAGANTLVAQVWTLGPDSAFAQFTHGHGFILSPDESDLIQAMATGVAPWKVKPLAGYRFINPQSAWGTGFNLLVDGEGFDWAFERGEGEGWKDPIVGEVGCGPGGENDKAPRRLLVPATLPAMVHAHWNKARVRHISFPAPGPTAAVPLRPEDHLEEEVLDWTRLIIGHPLTIPPYSRRRVLLDLHDYVCAYPELTTSKGRHSQIRINWQEALFETYRKSDKGNRDEIDNKYFCSIYNWEDGVGDTFLPDGGDGRKFTTLWWQAGRYVEVLIQTQLEELVIDALQFREDRYPFENRLKFESSDPQLESVGHLAFRTLQMCSHETYMDCPFYEQLQYIGDTRLQVLVTYLTSEDDRLPRKALQMFNWSRQVDGVTQSRYPSRVTQIIPPFSLWWVCMIWDFALWRGDKTFVASLLPGARLVLDWFRSCRNALGLVEAPRGWNFVDWVPGWDGGMPLGADDGVSSILNRQFEIALRKMAEVEAWLGEPEMAARNLRHAEEVASAIHRSFWSTKRGMYADDLAHTSYSEHAQVLSLLTGVLPDRIAQLVAQGLLIEQDLHQTTVYFSHYLFECFAALGRTDRILDRMGLWKSHLTNGLKTIIEMPEPTRSDCHAWGAHPLYHYVASFLGVRPKGLGSRELLIRPNLGGLEHAQALFPFAGVLVTVSARQAEGGMDLQIELPEGFSAVVEAYGKRVNASIGKNTFRILQA